MNHIHVINQLIEKNTEYNKPLYMAITDYEMTLDSVEIQAVIEALRYQGVLEAYAKFLANIYKYSTATSVLHKKSGTLPIKKGVRQGGTISAMLFTACLEEVFKLLDWEGLGVRIDGNISATFGLQLTLPYSATMGMNYKKLSRTLTEKV